MKAMRVIEYVLAWATVYIPIWLLVTLFVWFARGWVDTATAIEALLLPLPLMMMFYDGGDRK